MQERLKMERFIFDLIVPVGIFITHATYFFFQILYRNLGKQHIANVIKLRLVAIMYFFIFVSLMTISSFFVDIVKSEYQNIIWELMLCFLYAIYTIVGILWIKNCLNWYKNNNISSKKWYVHMLSCQHY